MPLKKITLKVPFEYEGKRLDHVLADWLPQALKQPLSKGKVRKLIVAGAVYLNKKRIRIASKEIRAQAMIEVFVDLEKLYGDTSPHESLFEMSADRVLFEDEYLIIVNKPPGLPTQPTLDEARQNLFASMKKYIATRNNIPVSQAYVGLHHRLDRDTSGVILFTKSVEANPGVSKLFSSHDLVKTYQALAISKKSEKIENSWSVKNYLDKVSSGSKNAKFGSVRSGGKFAHTDFRVIQQIDRFLYLDAVLHTGRTHQIRVHLSENGMPIFGDMTYGGEEKYKNLKAPRLMLHAVSLTFTHPIHKNKIAVECPLPEDFVRCLSALQKDFRGL